MARVNEFRQRHLNQRVAAAIEFGMGAFQIANQRTRQHDIPQPQPRVESLTECSDIDDRRVGNQSLQRRNRLAGKAKFAVVIILDDPAAVLARQSQQALTALQAHHRPQRILMRWGDKNQVRRRLNCLRRAQAVGIDGNGIDPHIIHRQHVTDPPVGGSSTHARSPLSQSIRVTRSIA